MGTGGSFPPGQSGRSVKLTTHLHLEPRLRMRGDIPPLPQYVSMPWYAFSPEIILLEQTKFDICSVTLPSVYISSSYWKHICYTRRHNIYLKTGPCEHCNELSASIESGAFTDQIRYYQFLNKDATTWVKPLSIKCPWHLCGSAFVPRESPPWLH
jgi:hypothetical protein